MRGCARVRVRARQLHLTRREGGFACVKDAEAKRAGVQGTRRLRRVVRSVVVTRSGGRRSTPSSGSVSAGGVCLQLLVRAEPLERGVEKSADAQDIHRVLALNHLLAQLRGLVVARAAS